MSLLEAVLTIVGVLILLAAAVAMVLIRRSHLRSWRMGVFYESEERVDGPGDSERRGEEEPSGGG